MKNMSAFCQNRSPVTKTYDSNFAKFKFMCVPCWVLARFAGFIMHKHKSSPQYFPLWGLHESLLHVVLFLEVLYIFLSIVHRSSNQAIMLPNVICQL